jgi:hypothetical protein
VVVGPEFVLDDGTGAVDVVVLSLADVVVVVSVVVDDVLTRSEESAEVAIVVDVGAMVFVVVSCDSVEVVVVLSCDAAVVVVSCDAVAVESVDAVVSVEEVADCLQALPFGSVFRHFLAASCSLVAPADVSPTSA